MIHPPALRLLEKCENEKCAYITDMPEIYDAQETLRDIYTKESHTSVMKWIHKNAAFNN